MNVWAIIGAMGIPTAVTTLGLWWIQRTIIRQEKQREKEEAKREAAIQEREKERQKMMVTLLTSINASIALGEATARAVERIPDANCNGDMHEALKYVQDVKHDQKEYLMQLGVKNLYEGE